MESLTTANKTIKDNATSENTHQATPALVLQGPKLAERLLPFFGVLWTEASDENCYQFHSSTHAQSIPLPIKRVPRDRDSRDLKR